MARREVDTNSRDRHGYVKINRKVFDGCDEYWPKDRPYSPFEAWVDLIQLAAWKPVRMNGVRLERGQVLVSVRFLSQRWKWEQTRIHRWLKSAKKCERLVQHSTQQAGTVYSLVNYDTYQGVPDPSATPSATRSATQVQHPRNKEEAVKQLNNPINNPTTPPPASTKPTASSKNGKASRSLEIAPYADALFERFWKAYPKRAPNNPKKPARKVWNARVKQGVDPEVMIAAAERYRRHCDATDTTGTKFVKQSQSWLSPDYEGWLQSWDLPANPEATAPAFPDYPEPLVL